jgi:hypothetical protein
MVASHEGLQTPTAAQRPPREVPMSLDNFITNGSAHTCPIHDVRWHDVDGGCPKCMADEDDDAADTYERAVRDLIDAIDGLRGSDAAMRLGRHTREACIGLGRWRVTVERVTP